MYMTCRYGHFDELLSISDCIGNWGDCDSTLYYTYGNVHMNNASMSCLIVWRILFEFTHGLCSINDNGYGSSLLEYKLNRF